MDDRIKILIQNGIVSGHRSMFFVIGERACSQVVLFHDYLYELTNEEKPSILWCYKDELTFNTNKRRRTQKSSLKRGKSEEMNETKKDLFETFINSAKVQFCRYKDSSIILGKTFGMCILQDFEALTPNILARCLETVKGGGIIIFILSKIKSLKELFTIRMDIHKRFRTTAHQDVIERFNERFVLSLSSCQNCLVVNDQLQILPYFPSHLCIKSNQQTNFMNTQIKINMLKENFKNTHPAKILIDYCKTLDQANILLECIKAIEEKNCNTTISLIAARGRGKSATLGLAISAAIRFNYSNIFVSSPSPENVSTLFEFVSRGLNALEYRENLNFNIIKSTNPEFNKATVQINVFKDHQQVIKYISPNNAIKLSQAELLVIDEAAAIPLSYVKTMLGPYLMFLSSTVNGYEGTGRSLSLKLLQQLREQANSSGDIKKNKQNKMNSIRQLKELVLEESIRYKPGDVVEQWLNDLLCLNVTVYRPILSSCPEINDCELYYINRDTLFSYNKFSELFLQRLISIYVSSHYKNSPNDLQMIADAPAHHLFCLMSTINADDLKLSEILVVIQVCVEGKINKEIVNDNLSKGRRPAGDLIPWLMAQLHPNSDFPSLCGFRVVRIATHPDYQNKRYATHALELLKKYQMNKRDSCMKSNEIQKNILQIDTHIESIEPRSDISPLLIKLNECQIHNIDYIGVSFGLTEQLLRFWKRSGFILTYIRSSENEITGEHSCIMICDLHNNEQNWLENCWIEFTREFISGLSGPFRSYSSCFAMSLITNNKINVPKNTLNKQELYRWFSPNALHRLKMFSTNMTDYQVICNFIPDLAKLYFSHLLGETKFSPTESVLLIGLGLQRKTVNTLTNELDLPSFQLMNFLNSITFKAVQYFDNIVD